MVKEIAATPAEIQRFQLRAGDILMTEGGDPDKLGRGTVWRDELPLSLHQNHIFRVRVRDSDSVHPLYLSWFTSSRPARAYFLRSAKQTTGIASINKSQLNALPVAIPSRNQQLRFVDAAEGVRAIGARARSASDEADQMFKALQAQAFSGQL